MEDTIRKYITDNLLFGGIDVEFDNDSSLLELGIVDSVGVMELVLYVEENYDLQIEDDEIIPENFDSISQLANYIRSKQDSNND